MKALHSAGSCNRSRQLQRLTSKSAKKKEKKEKGEERKDGAPVPLKLKKVAKGTWHFGNRMDRKRVEVVAETAAVTDTGRRSVAQCSRSSRHHSQAEEEAARKPEEHHSANKQMRLSSQRPEEDFAVQTALETSHSTERRRSRVWSDRLDRKQLRLKWWQRQRRRKKTSQSLSC